VNGPSENICKKRETTWTEVTDLTQLIMAGNVFLIFHPYKRSQDEKKDMLF
jgi:hypothetical protein